MTLFCRVKRNSTQLIDYLYDSRKLIFNLKKRGYDYETLKKISRTVSDLDRNKLVQYKNKNNLFNSIDGKTFIYKTFFDNNIPNMHKCIQNAYNRIKSENNLINDTQIKIINRMQPNLGAILLHNFRIPGYKKYFCNQCYLNNCKICKYMNINYKIKINQNCVIPIVNNSNCNAINCIYIIFCKKCKMFYVGETINLQSRMYNHINDIKTFKPFETKDKCVPLHFRTKNHVENDFSFFVLQSNINNDEYRFQIETYYIHLIARIDRNLLINTKINKLFLINRNRT